MSNTEKKLKAIEGVLDCLADDPFKPEFDGVFMSRRSMAEVILNRVEAVTYMASVEAVNVT